MGEAVLISLHCIVKNEAELLPVMLKSIRDFVDEMIVVDTGSTDGTQDLAQSLGARVEHFIWIDDFSAARNYALSFVKTPWTIWLDADDMVLNPQVIAQEIQAAHKIKCSGLWSNYLQDEACHLKRLQIFKPKDFRWEGVIHENPMAKNKFIETSYGSLHVLHQKPEHRRFEACEKYLKILLEKDPENWLGIAESYKLMAHKEPEKYTALAFDYYLKAMDHPLINDGTKYIACFHCSRLALEAAKMNQKDSATVEIAFKMAQLGIALEPNRAECYVILAQLYHALGRWDEAEQNYQKALSLPIPQDTVGLIYPAYFRKLPQYLLNMLQEQKPCKTT